MFRHIALNYFDVFLTVHHSIEFLSSYQLNAHFLYSITIYMLHQNPQHVSSSTLLIFRRTNCIITASGIVTLCKRLYSMPVERDFSAMAAVACVFCKRIRLHSAQHTHHTGHTLPP